MGRARRRLVPRDDLIPVELAPAWADREPPRLAEIRAGIRYLGIEPSAGLAALRSMSPIVAIGTLGSAIWVDGPRPAEHDLEAWDEVRECKVCERPWPWCWGDVVTFVGREPGNRLLAVTFDAADELAAVFLSTTETSPEDLGVREADFAGGGGEFASLLPLAAFVATTAPR